MKYFKDIIYILIIFILLMIMWGEHWRVDGFYKEKYEAEYHQKKLILGSMLLNDWSDKNY